MLISELIESLQEMRSQFGEMEVSRVDGKPFTFATIVDKKLYGDVIIGRVDLPIKQVP
jgi:hypothetical protein